VLSLYSSSFAPANDIQKKSGLTGMVLDSGDGVTHCKINVIFNIK
jgi:hypothetical protein